MRKLTIEESAERLSALSRVCILFHVRPDGDAVGSAFALRHALTRRGCDAWCVCADEVPDRLHFLLSLGGRAVQESVLPEAMPERFADAPVVTVDTAALPQAGALADALLPRCVLMIDHHASGTPYADHCIDANAAAAGEVLLPLLCAIADDGRPDPLTAACLFAAIASDSGCFKFNNTTAATHRAAAELLDCGIASVIDPAELLRRLFDEKSAAVLKCEQLALSNLKLFRNGEIVISSLTHAEREENRLRAEDADTMIDAIRVRAGCAIAAVLKQLGDTPRWRVSLRSTKADVAAVAARFGGGGHIRAAGCTIEAETREDAIARLTAELLSVE